MGKTGAWSSSSAAATMETAMRSSSGDRAAARRTAAIAGHLVAGSLDPSSQLTRVACLQYDAPSSGPGGFDSRELRRVLDGHDVETRDWLFRAMEESPLFRPAGDKAFSVPDYNQGMEQQREVTMRRIEYLGSRGVFHGWMTRPGPEQELRKLAAFECFSIFDHSLAIKLGVHFLLWGGAIQFFGTKRHHDKWLKETENYSVKGSFSMTELGHGSNVRGIETIATYDSSTREFIINTPCESAQKYWIGGAANHATHTIIFSQLYINGTNHGVHAFIAQIRDYDGNVCPNIRIADCGHKIGLNGVDNGRIWFDNLRVPRENLLNSVADVLPDGTYVTAIKDPIQRFAAFLAPLTSGRVNIACSALYVSKIGLAIAVRYALTRRAFSIEPDGPEVLLLDYPSHQRRLLSLVAKSCAMTFACNNLKKLYANRSPETIKALHIYSSGLKAMTTWHNIRTLQECREACGGQGMKTENRIGILKGEFDVQSTFEGDNKILMQQVSKALFAEYISAMNKKRPFKGLGLEHMNELCPVVPDNVSCITARSVSFQVGIFCLRERDLLKRFAAEVHQHQARGESREVAMNLSFVIAEELGKSFAERVVLQSIIDAEMAMSAGPLKDVMALLRSLYALTCIEEDASFLRYGYLSPGNDAVVRKEVMKLCCDLRPLAFSVVNSFGIPDSFLAPIAFNWIEANSFSKL